MTDDLKIHHGELQEKSREIKQIAEEIRSQLDGAQKHIEFLMGDWIGKASTAFNDLWLDWQNSAGKCHTDLVVIADALDKTGVSFLEHEDIMTNSLRRMRTS